jgi:hypothetical protein
MDTYKQILRELVELYRILQQYLDGTNTSSYSITCSGNQRINIY